MTILDLTGMVIFFGSIGLFIWGFAYSLKLYGIFLEGKSDASYPSVASGDVHVGFKRALYLRGYAKGVVQKKLDKAKRRMTKEREKERLALTERKVEKKLRGY